MVAAGANPRNFIAYHHDLITEWTHTLYTKKIWLNTTHYDLPLSLKIQALWSRLGQGKFSWLTQLVPVLQHVSFGICGTYGAYVVSYTDCYHSELWMCQAFILKTKVIPYRRRLDVTSWIIIINTECVSKGVQSALMYSFSVLHSPNVIYCIVIIREPSQQAVSTKRKGEPCCWINPS